MLSKFRVYASVVFVVVLLMLSGAVIAQEEETGPAYTNLRWDAPTYAQHGPYWIGTREIEVENGERLLRGNIWYPALNPDGVAYEDYSYSSYTEAIWESWGMGAEWASLYGTALGDAPIDASDAPYPLIILTHGLATSRTTLVYLAEHLASYGFVVMAVDHPGGGFSDQLTFGLGTPEFNAFVPLTYIDWALDEMRVIEYAGELTNGDGNLSGIIDTSRVGSMGYSTGGFIALQLAGAQFDFASIAEGFGYCDNPPAMWADEFETACVAMPAMEADLAEAAGVVFVSGEPWGVIAEPIVQAVYAIAPGNVTPFGNIGFDAVTVPTVVIGGTLDTPVLLQNTYNTLGSDMKSMIWLENADHFPFIDCGWQTPFFGGFCADGVWDMNRAHDLTNHFATALFLSILYDDADAMSALHPDAVDFAGITYETTISD